MTTPDPRNAMADIKSRNADWEAMTPEEDRDCWTPFLLHEAYHAAARDRRDLLAALAAQLAAPPLDVERLARAIRRVLVPILDDGDIQIAAPAIAAEYDRLAVLSEPKP